MQSLHQAWSSSEQESWVLRGNIPRDRQSCLSLKKPQMSPGVPSIIITRPPGSKGKEHRSCQSEVRGVSKSHCEERDMSEGSVGETILGKHCLLHHDWL